MKAIVSAGCARRSLVIAALLAVLLGVGEAPAFPVANQAAGNFPSYNGTHYVVGLEDHASVPPAIRARRLDGAGAGVGAPIDLGGSGIAVNAAFDGQRHFVTWEDGLSGGGSAGWSVRGRFLTPEGATSGAEVVVTPGHCMVDGAHYLAYGGGVYLVAYTRFINPALPDPNQSENHCIAVRLVGRDGAVGPDLRVSTGNGQGPGVTFDGERFLVAWCEDIGDAEVRARFVAPDGTLGAEFSVNASPAPSDNPIAVAFDGRHHLVAWCDETAGMGTMTWDVFAQRLDTAGQRVGPVITVANGPAPEIVTSVSFDGRNFLVGWVALFTEMESDMKARFIDRAGSPVAPEFVVDAQPGAHFGGLAFAAGAHLALVTAGQIGDGGFTQVGGVTGQFIAPVGARPREDWAAAAFGGQAGNPLVAGDTADPDRDGLPNLLEYALGGDPLVSSVTVAPAPGLEAGRLGLVFRRPASSELLYRVEASDDLLNWETITLLHAPSSTWFGPGARSDTLDGAWRDAVVLDPREPGGARRFLRVRVESTW